MELLARAIRDSGNPTGPRSLLSFVDALIPFKSSLITRSPWSPEAAGRCSCTTTSVRAA